MQIKNNVFEIIIHQFSAVYYYFILKKKIEDIFCMYNLVCIFFEFINFFFFLNKIHVLIFIITKNESDYFIFR